MKSKRGTNGSYIYTGIASHLKNITLIDETIKLLVNVDGLPQ